MQFVSSKIYARPIYVCIRFEEEILHIHIKIKNSA